MRTKQAYFGVDVKSGDVAILIEIAIPTALEVLSAIAHGALSVWSSSQSCTSQMACLQLTVVPESRVIAILDLSVVEAKVMISARSFPQSVVFSIS